MRCVAIFLMFLIDTFVCCLLSISDKQQEFDLPSMRIDETDIANCAAAVLKQRSRSPRFGGPPGPPGPPMSQISGVTRPLLAHTNSFTGEKVPMFGVETPHETALATHLSDVDTWGIDIFKISELSCNRPLTAVAFTVFQVIFLMYFMIKTMMTRQLNIYANV